MLLYCFTSSDTAAEQYSMANHVIEPRHNCWVLLGNAGAFAPLVGDQVNQGPDRITLQALTLLNHCSLTRSTHMLALGNADLPLLLLCDRC